MKNSKRIFFAGLFVAGFLPVQAQQTSAEGIIQQSFAALKAKDEKAFIALYPNGSQFGQMVKAIMQQALGSPEVQQALAMDPKTKDMNIDSLIEAESGKVSSPEAFAEMQKGFGAKFQQTISKGESKGVNWSDASFTSVSIDSSGGDMEGEMAALKTAGFKTMKGVIDFKSAGTDYQMSFDKLMFIPAEGKWFGGEFPNVVKKGESLAEVESDLATDSLAVVTEMPKTKSKSKTKTPTTKTKTKTKTPARKPAAKS